MANDRTRGKAGPFAASDGAGADQGDGSYGSGTPIEVFRPSRGEPMAGLIASGVLLVAAVSIFGVIVRELATSTRPRTFLGPGWSWFLLGAVAVAAFLLLVIGLALAARSRFAMSFRAELFAEGLRVVRLGARCDFWWEWLDSIREERVRDYLTVAHLGPGASVGLPVGKSLYLVLRRVDGSECRIGPEQLQRDLERLRQRLHEEASRRGIPWLVTHADPGPLHTPLSPRR